MQNETKTDLFNFIEATLRSNNIVLFMKGTKKAPQCGFSAQVVQILESYSLVFKDINVFEIEGLREEIKKFTNWPTIPQLYVKGNFIGGADIVRDLHQANTLLDTLNTR